jgi:hypothetical protein
MTHEAGNEAIDPTRVWDRELARRDYLHIFERTGRRVTRNDLEYDDWKAWKLELVKKLQLAIWFFYGNFVHGVRRCVIDGVEPTDKPSESFQFDLFEYIYHQILHKDADWVARDLFREHFRAHADEVLERVYDHNQIGCLLLYTTREVMLDDLLGRPLDSGDVRHLSGHIHPIGPYYLAIAARRAGLIDLSFHPDRTKTSGAILTALLAPALWLASLAQRRRMQRKWPGVYEQNAPLLHALGSWGMLTCRTTVLRAMKPNAENQTDPAPTP